MRQITQAVGPALVVLHLFLGRATAAEEAQSLPSGVPAWLVENPPENMKPYIGKAGLLEPWSAWKTMLGSGVGGIDAWQATHFIVYRPETAAYLYASYTPLKVNYRKGTLALFEKAAARATAGRSSDRERILAFLKEMPDISRHPTIPPLGERIRTDRNLLDEDLLTSRSAWCNEQARVFVRLCQVSGIPARMIFLFYADGRSGHVVAEIHADGRWSMVDSSWLAVFPAADGHLMSAAEIHDSAQGKARAAEVMRTRYRELLKLSDERLGPRPDEARRLVQDHLDHPKEFGLFGILNYPLPQ